MSVPNLAPVADRAPTSTPVAVTDVLLQAALGSQADLLWIEPVANSDNFQVSIEREGRVLATTTLDAGLGSAVIARLALIAGVDLTSPRVATGTIRTRARGVERELVFTLRPGAELRAEAMFLSRTTGPRIATATTHADLEPGALVDHYYVLQRLGEGGMGSVYLVEHVTLGRQYALKVLHGKVLQHDATSVDRFLREARAASRIRHPHIVDVFDFGYLFDGRPYFVMEMLEGTSLAHMIDAGALQPTDAVSIARQLGEALAAAHENGVIHADISAGNVLAEQRGDQVFAKLVDFGLAELRGPGMPLPTASEIIFGTPCYIAPELVRGLPADEKSDQYSYGILVFEMLAGQTPFYDDNVRTLCLQHLRDPVPPLRSPHGPLPDELVKLVERCMQKSPAARFPSMRALLAELTQVTRLVERRGWRRWLSP